MLRPRKSNEFINIPIAFEQAEQTPWVAMRLKFFKNLLRQICKSVMITFRRCPTIFKGSLSVHLGGGVLILAHAFS